MMKRPRHLAPLAALVLLASSSGCGPGGLSGGTGPDPSINAATADGPHGGPALPLPAGLGFVEILIERGARPVDSRLVAYLLGPDLKAPLAAKPTDLRATFDVPAGLAPLALVATATTTAAPGVARHASAPARFDDDEYQGRLSCQIDGQAVTLPFALR